MTLTFLFVIQKIYDFFVALVLSRIMRYFSSRIQINSRIIEKYFKEVEVKQDLIS